MYGLKYNNKLNKIQKNNKSIKQNEYISNMMIDIYM